MALPQYSAEDKLADEDFYETLDRRAWLFMQGFDMVDGVMTKVPQCAPLFLKSQVTHQSSKLAQSD